MPEVLRPPNSTSLGHLISTAGESPTVSATASATDTAAARTQVDTSVVATSGRNTMEVYRF